MEKSGQEIGIAGKGREAGKVWPRISVITPSFNQAEFLERTLFSVLDQGYPNLEYIVIDGGSTDGSVEILKQYDDRLAYWVSEKDRGQSHALNKGFERATGEILGWLNSDDLYCHGALHHVGQWFLDHPQDEVHYGGLYLVDENDRITDAHWAAKPDVRYTYFVGMDVHQQSLFWKRELMERVGMIDESFRFSMDLDFVLRLMLHGRVSRTTHYLGKFREHQAAKTSNIADICLRENQVIFDRYRKFFPPRPGLKHWLSLQRTSSVAVESPSYFAFKIGQRLKLQVPVQWLGAERI
ncbi:MAG: glycosyltransferase family 2 protein [Acidobacteriota bacterium]|nr:glycosyltransferase family 2 protein [Acidobacteriota bacterium]